MPGHRQLRGHDLPLRALEPRPRPDRRARGGDRHRRLGDPVRARDPAAGRAAARVPAHRAVGACPTPDRRHAATASAGSTGACPRRSARCAPAIYWARETFVLLFRHPRHAASASSGWRCGTCTRRSRTPSCARKLTPNFAIGLQAHPARPTSGTPRSTQPNVDVVTDGIREVAAALDRHRRRRREREVDTIIFGTGFHVTDIPIAQQIRGRDGRTLAEAWDGSPRGLPRHHRRRLPEPVPAGRARTPASATTRSSS